MAAYQPRGIFVGDSPEDLAAMKAAARARINGQVTSFTEAGGSTTKSLGMPPDEVLIEVNYAMQAATGTLAPSSTRPNFGGTSNAYYGGGFTHDPTISDCL